MDEKISKEISNPNIKSKMNQRDSFGSIHTQYEAQRLQIQVSASIRELKVVANHLRSLIQTKKKEKTRLHSLRGSRSKRRWFVELSHLRW